LLGGEIAIQMVGVFGIVGCIIISFYHGWKLSLLGIGVIMPIVISAGYYRVRLERDVERQNADLFAETAQYGAEAISAFRTVTALGMEGTIVQRFDKHLKAHVRDSLRKAWGSNIILAISESVDLFCQALFFWYFVFFAGDSDKY
jgi:ATP-binding cassette, subfamily B (MDR/TAP), member 1